MDPYTLAYLAGHSDFSRLAGTSIRRHIRSGRQWNARGQHRVGTVLKCRRRDWLNQLGFSVSKDGKFPVPKLVEEPGARTAPFHVVVNWRMPSPKPRRTSVRIADNTLEAALERQGVSGQLEVLLAAMNPSTLPLMVPICSITGMHRQPR